MDVKKKSIKKIPIWAILVALMVFLAGCVVVVTLQESFQKVPIVSSEEKIRAYLSSDDSEDNGVTPEEADAWLQEFLSSEEKGSVEINRTLIIKKGYTISGTKTITGDGIFLAENSGGGNIFSVSEKSSLVVEGIHIDCNYNMNVGVNVKANATLTWKGGSIARAMDYGIFAGGDIEITDSSIQDCGVWVELRSGAKVNVKDTEFYKCGSAGIMVAKDSECHLTGEKTLIEQSGREAVKNEGTFSMTDGNIYMTNGYGIDNFGTVNLTGVKQNRSVQGGLVLNEIDATANLKDCVLWNNTYHVRNYGEMNLENCELNMSVGSSILNEPEGTVNINGVTVKNGNNYAIYNRNGVANVKDLECELILNTGIVNIGDGIVKVDGYSIDRCQMAIENRSNDEYGYGEIYANNVTVKNAGNRNIFSWGGVCNISNSTLYPSQGYSVYIRGGSAVLDSVKILGTIKETSGGLAVGSTIYKDPVVTIKGDTEITGCASRGIINYNKLTIYNCDIHDNNTSGKLTSGAGIYSVGDVYMHGGKIHDNYGTKYGAGIRLDRNDKEGLIGNLYMYGGSIYDNEAGISGGGVSVAKKCVFEMRGGSIYNNIGAVRGDGMVLSGTFNLYDADKLGDNDIYLVAGNTINVKTDKLSFDLAKLSLESYSSQEVVVFPSKAAAEKLCGKFTTKNHQFDITQSENAGILVHNTTDFDTVYDFSKAEVVKVTTFEELKMAVEDTKMNASKVIVVGADIVMADTVTLPQRTNIKLTDDGTARKLVRGTDKNLFMIGRVSYLVLGGKAGIAIDGDALNGKVAKTSLVCVNNFGYFVLEEGGALQNAFNTGTTTDGGVRGGAINVAMDGYFDMKGGTITNCSSPDDEKYHEKYCAIYGSSSSGISIKGGTISNCNDRAILSYNHVYMSAGTIENCQHIQTGGAAVRTPMFKMTGGTIQNCLSTNAGSAVYIKTGSFPQGYFQLNGGTITGNKNGTTLSTQINGGAVYIDEYAAFDFKSGTISNNVAGDKDYRMTCAAILNEGEAHIGKDAIITGNEATLSPGAIYNRTKGTMTIIGATITDNTSTNVQWYNPKDKKEVSYGSGAAIKNEGTMILDGAKVTDNHVGTYGTVHSGAGSMTLKDMTFSGNQSGANEVIYDAYGNKRDINNKGIDLAVAVGTKSVTLSGKIVATETDAAFRLNLDETFTLADDFSTDSKINLYLHGNVYVGRPVLEGNVSPETVACITWTNPKEGYYLADDGCIRADRTEAAIGDAEYVTLEEAVAAAKEGDTIMLLSDVSLAKQLVIKKSITITTDGKADRTIYCEAGAAGTAEKPGHVIVIEVPGKEFTFKGASEDSRLIFDGNSENDVTLSRAFIYPGSTANAAAKVTMQYVTMQNIKGTYNYGSAICSNAPIEAEHCIFIKCEAESKTEDGVANANGGAIYTAATASGTKFTHCQFEGCSSNYRGGAIYTKGEITIKDSQFTGCSATNRGGAVYSEKGMSVIGCSFGDNSVKGGNTAGNAGGAILVQYENTLNIKDSTFVGNRAEGNFGGAVAMSTGTSTINLYGNITFDGNSTGATDHGGGAIMTGSVLNIAENANVTIKNNETKGLGGGIYFNATNTPVFTLGEGAVLSMSGNTDKNGTVDVGLKDDTLQEGDKFVYGSNVPENIFNVMVSNVQYKVDANGYLVGTNPNVELRQEGLTRQFATLEGALAKAEAGDTIALIADITLNKQLEINKSVTVTTDGEANRTIYCGAEAASGVVVSVGSDVDVTIKGESKDSQLIFDGNGQSMKNVFVAASGEVTMKNITMQNITTSGSYGAAICITSPATVENCNFVNCKSTSGSANGGAIYISAAGAGTRFTDCHFDQCSSDYRGGAIYTKGSITVEGSRFTENESENAGGAILVDGSITLNITDSIFTENKASGNFGGAVAFSNKAGTLNLSGTCIFDSNEAKASGNWKGGAIFAPKTFTVKENAWIEIFGNENTGSNNGDAIGLYVENETDAKFTIEKNAAVYVYENPSAGDGDNDICIKAGTEFDTSKIKGEGKYYTWKPVAKIGNVGYKSLADAIDAVDDGGEIPLIHDVTLSSQLAIDKSVTITTDGKADRTIYCGAGAASGVVISVTADKKVTFKGASESSQLIFDGNGQSMKNVFVAASGEVTMKNVTMQNITTSGSYGAAVCITSPATVENCNFVNCESTSNSANGGAIYISAAGAETSITNCGFDQCSSKLNGGAIMTKGAITVTGSKFTKCHADNRGGAIYSEVTGVTINGCTFGDKDDIANGGNTSGNAGGAIHVQGTRTLNIEASHFFGNKAAYFGGAVSFSSGGSTLNLAGRCVFRGNVSADATCTTETNYTTLDNARYRGGAIMAPVNFNIKAGAWVEMFENESKYIGEKPSGGDAICINTTNENVATFKVEEGAALYIYNNPSTEDADQDICIQYGANFSSFTNNGTYSTSAPTTK